MRLHKVVFILGLSSLVASSSAIAAPSKKGGLVSSAEPLLNYGVLRSKDGKSNSTPLSYGAYLNFGYRPFSLEVGMLEGFAEKTTNSSSATSSTKVEKKSVKLRLGLRGNIPLLSFLDVIVRTGIEGQRQMTTTTVTTAAKPAGEETSTGDAMYGYGYLGTGLSIRFTDQVAFNIAGSTTFKKAFSIKKNDYDASVGIQYSQPIP